MWQIISINIFKLILKVVPVLSLTVVFNFFSWVSDDLTFTLLHSTIYTSYRTFAVLFANSSIASFDFSRIFVFLILYQQLLQQLLEILFVELLSDQHLMLFVYLNQLQIVCNCLWNMHKLINNKLHNHHLTLLILFRLHHTVLLCH